MGFFGIEELNLFVELRFSGLCPSRFGPMPLNLIDGFKMSCRLPLLL